MTIILVAHDTLIPSLDCMIAGEMAAERGARFAPLVSGGAGLSRFDCVQHVLEQGELAPNGVLWAERACGRPVDGLVDRGAVARLPDEIVLVPLNPAIASHGEAVARIEAGAIAAGRRLERYDVTERESAFEVRRQGATAPVSLWTRDKFGRPVRSGFQSARTAGAPLRILIIADEILQREVYPANIAALGDAADALDLDVALSFIDPRMPQERAWEKILAEADGVLLPGGSDMEQVRGQIDVARAALRTNVPTLGLCLGMQTMSTAVAQEGAGLNDANLAEADPTAQTKTFVRLRDEKGRPEFRLGVRPCRIVPGTCLSQLLGGAAEIDVHYNHRFVLETTLHEPLAAAGLRISGLHEDRDFADAIEAPGLTFFMGMQGHPELASRRGRPHPLITGFLFAAAARENSQKIAPIDGAPLAASGRRR
ncbi:gamma-glutamyl-gamma-aminobutyrate hydrolase family protein [Methylocapsa sp. S129]|uniref:glutamine amidotransferase-related protein n=1 Tax=Methylocapsa sp. S129 TaxID=1641869 RepID=UPI00131DEA4E|nr:gamma-glutamyl-gamma-aminobutyrate hydrolase family protein [Methylocapsa sp. S129]